MSTHRWQLEEKDQEIKRLQDLLYRTAGVLNYYIEHFEHCPFLAKKAKQVVTEIQKEIEVEK